MTTFSFREGTTEPVTIKLKNGGFAADITGYTSVTIFLRSQDGITQVEKATGGLGVVVITTDPAVIEVSFAATDLLFSKQLYAGYIIVVDGTAKRSSFPSDGEFVFRMLERYSGDG